MEMVTIYVTGVYRTVHVYSGMCRESKYMVHFCATGIGIYVWVYIGDAGIYKHDIPALFLLRRCEARFTESA